MPPLKLELTSPFHNGLKQTFSPYALGVRANRGAEHTSSGLTSPQHTNQGTREDHQGIDVLTPQAKQGEMHFPCEGSFSEDARRKSFCDKVWGFFCCGRASKELTKSQVCNCVPPSFCTQCVHLNLDGDVQLQENAEEVDRQEARKSGHSVKSSNATTRPTSTANRQPPGLISPRSGLQLNPSYISPRQSCASLNDSVRGDLGQPNSQEEMP